MEKKEKQMRDWKGEFGEEYTDRNLASPEEYDALMRNRIGVSRSEQLDDLLRHLRLDKILEVGANVGNQLLLMRGRGITNLYGIELNHYAVEKAKDRTKGTQTQIEIIESSAYDIPFKDEYFDLVFTSGLLIHIPPYTIGKVLDEVYRCTKRYILGFEYYSKNYTETNYRGNDEMLWKADFAKMYLDRFPRLWQREDRKYPYLEDEKLIDHAFLFEKRGEERSICKQ